MLLGVLSVAGFACLMQFVDGLTLQEAAEVLAALGALNCYPEKLLAALLPRTASL